MIRLTDLGSRYSTGVTVHLDGDHLLVPGTITRLTGSNGVGKSTILRTIAGIQPAFAGCRDVPEAWTVRYIPTSLSQLFLPWYSVRKNLSILSGQASGSGCEDLAASLIGPGFQQVRDQHAYEPSAGELAALAIACALASAPNAVLLDETTSFAAEDMLRRIVGALEAFTQSGGILLFASHNPIPFTSSVRNIPVRKATSR